MKIKSISICALLVLSSCSVLEDTSKQEFSTGAYKSKIFDHKTQNVYVNNENDVLTVFPLHKNESKNFAVDTLQNKKLIFVQETEKTQVDTPLFIQNSFDVDFLTIPFKYRPSQKDLPKQFNTNLNGEVYFGYRTDMYKLKYKSTPFNKFVRKTNHYAFSFGLFTGFGGTTMNPSVTQEKITKEYDGLVWSKGIAGIIGINNFTIGLALGYDNLLDQNKQYWIYQQKSWYGLAFGLNLN